MDQSRATTRRPPVRRSAAGLVVRGALCVLAVTPLLRWAVVVHAVRPGRPWRRACPRCATLLGPGWNLGALSPRARCGNCRLRIGPPPWTLELVTAGTAVALVAAGLTGLRLAAYGWWAALGVVLLFVDLAVQRLPTRLSYAAVAGFLVLLGCEALVDDAWEAWIRSVLGALIAASTLAVCAMAMPGLVHWGDVRYALAVGAAAAFVSWLGLYAAAFFSTLFAAVVGGGLIVARRATLATHLPQGPFLFGGTLVAVVLLGQ
jgi:leader peptidase (prepilin peptidase) / N-methyltransferase